MQVQETTTAYRMLRMHNATVTRYTYQQVQVQLETICSASFADRKEGHVIRV